MIRLHTIYSQTHIALKAPPRILASIGIFRRNILVGNVSGEEGCV